jgi:hypothetical protein
VSILSRVEVGPFVVVVPVVKMGGAGGNSVLLCPNNCPKGPVAGWEDSPTLADFFFSYQAGLEVEI